jgi:uncharacterized protein (TIGR02147 family)
VTAYRPSTVAELPDVLEYDDYRAYLRAFYGAKKARRGGFSLRAFSQSAGLTSSNYLKLVMDGARNLSPATAERFAEACGLRGQSASYFCALVAYGQAESGAERERAYRALRGHRRFRAVHVLDDAYAAYHAEWYIPAIRELAARPDFQADPHWIAARMLPAIPPRAADKALSVLRELGMLKDDEAGVPRQVHALVDTPDRPLGVHVVKYHRAMLERASEAIDAVPREQREIAALTLCLSEAQLTELKARLVSLRRELLEEYTAGPDARRVVQVNFQLFPLTKEES